MNRKEFQRLAAIRLREAQSLLDAGFAEGAYYLAGYAVEFALKACISKTTARHDFPDLGNVRKSHTHDLESLVKVADLEASLKEARLQPDFDDNWKAVGYWSEEARYKTWSMEDAGLLIRAIAHRKHGILQWVKRYW